MSHDPVFLYVEDDPLSRMVMEVLLVRALGYKSVSIFENSERFIERIEELPCPPDLILLDIHMRPYDGFTMIAMLQKHPIYRNTRVIAVTASVMNEEIDMLKRAGFNGAIAKPLDQDTFPSMLKSIMNGKEVWRIV